MADEQKPTTTVANGNDASADAAAAAEEELTAQQFLDQSDRSMALKHFDEASDGYAQALELLQEEHGQDAPILAPVLHRYGKCLLENAILTSGALGGGGNKEAPVPKQKSSGKSKSSKASGSSSKQPADPRFHFSGDADDDDEDEDDEGGQEGAAEEEDEDDLSVAFHTLDFTRVIYQKVLHGGKIEGDAPENPDATLETLSGEKWGIVRIKNELAEVLNDLGDVGLESENFQQASSDYEACLHILSPLLHPHSRRLADAYLRLGLALEFHPDTTKQHSTRQYIESATNTLKSRLEAVETRRAIQAQSGAEEERKQTAAAQAREEKVVEDSQTKGKGKSREEPVETDDVAQMDSIKLDSEAKDLKEIISDLEAKLQDLSSNTNAAASSSTASASAVPEDAKAALQQAINDAFLGGSTNAVPAAFGAPSSSAPVNDLSSMVRKKKKRAPEEEEDVGEQVDESQKGKGKEKSADVASDPKKAKVEE